MDDTEDPKSVPSDATMANWRKIIKHANDTGHGRVADNFATKEAMGVAAKERAAKDLFVEESKSTEEEVPSVVTVNVEEGGESNAKEAMSKLKQNTNSAAKKSKM